MTVVCLAGACFKFTILSIVQPMDKASTPCPLYSKNLDTSSKAIIIITASLYISFYLRGSCWLAAVSSSSSLSVPTSASGLV